MLDTFWDKVYKCYRVLRVCSILLMNFFSVPTSNIFLTFIFIVIHVYLMRKSHNQTRNSNTNEMFNRQFNVCLSISDIF